MKENARILIFDVPDRRSVPIVGTLGKKYHFDYLIPIRKGLWGQFFVILLFKIIKPRFSKHIRFIPFNDENDLAAGLIKFLNYHKYKGILAFSERSTALICKHKSQFPLEVSIPFGSFEDFNRLNDKYSILQIAQNLHIPTPKHIKIETIEDLDKAEYIGFPIVLKCRLASGVKEALRICDSLDELRKAYEELTSSKAQYSFFPNDELVAEEFIEGKIYDGCFSVKEGTILASITQKRDWTIPPSGGFGARNTTHNIPELIRYGKLLFGKVKWTGPAQLEFIYDEKQNEFKLIEINPRFWGTIALSIKADMKIVESIMQSIIFGSTHSYKKLTPEGITFEWLLQEAYTAERLQGKSWTVIFDHIKKIFGKEINNFSYSFGINLLLSLPHILNNPADIKPDNKISESLASKLFK